ncbi:DMT family transporter [Leisingera aquimarina]|uniref:DMT family transporter n=1 Tax=Leisingera aquimarina TaxID=476529 RepID=UPI0003FABF4B|nr:DMT family transporter [Leisingera aquimarina]
MQTNSNIAAAGLAMAASAILSFIDNFVFAVSQEAGLWQFQLFRTLFAVPMLLLGAHLLRQPLRAVNLPRLSLRSAAVSIGLLIYFAALGTLPVAQAGAGLFSAPIWVLLLSALLFGTRLSGLQLLAILAGFGGALMLLQPDFAALTPASLTPLGAGLFYGLGMLLTRHICAQESAPALAMGIFLFIGGAGLIMLTAVSLIPGADTAGPFLTRAWVTPTPRFLWLTLFQAAGAVVAVSLIAQAYRIGTPAFVSVFEYSFLIFACLWSFFLWGAAATPLAWTGIAVIITSGLAMSFLQKRDA